MIRPFRAETLRYGHYSVAGEFVYDHPFQWGSKRTGPDLHRVGGKYSDEWHRIHLINPRDLVPESNMPAYPWLRAAQASTPAERAPRMTALRALGVPYSDAEIAGSRRGASKGKTEMDALVAYLQVLGTAREVSEEHAHGRQRPAQRRHAAVASSLFLGIVRVGLVAAATRSASTKPRELPFDGERRPTREHRHERLLQRRLVDLHRRRHAGQHRWPACVLLCVAARAQA